MRVQAARKLLEEKGLDAAFIASPANIRYLSGFAGTDSYLYLSSKRQVILTDSRYTLQAEEEGKDCEVRTIKGERVYGVLLKELLEEDKVKRLGFEDGVMTWQFVKKLQEAAGDKWGEERWVPLGEELSLLRAVKDEGEIEKLARAEQIGDEAFSYILTQIKPGITELEIAAKLEYYMKSHGAQEKGFDTIAASGLHSAMPHAVPSEKVLEKGDFLTLDFGCKYQGYCSDMTRTVVIGKANEKQKEIYKIVLEAQEAALAGLRAGMTGAEGDALARKVIEEAGCGDYFGHGLGHSVGLEIHEKPALSPKD
ncbi:MAG: aminopeptidase P family protein, partial [Lachnospiraceae bacterium]|nr:aminopeptidase P family protein [Lachnospiraceae bacterium]